MNDDKQLVADTLNGKTESFEVLVRRYQDRLYNTLVHSMGNAHDAEEIVQEAMLQAYAKLKTFRGGSSFYTWLYRIAFNLWISRERKQRPRVSLDGIQEAYGMEPRDTADQPDARLQRTEKAMQLQHALGKLSEEYRAVLILREMEEWDYETISEMLNIPVGTVRSRLHRARMSLREHLSQLIIGESGSA